MQLPEPSESGMPIFLENSPQTICDQILWLVKNANLDFQLKETPFSINLSLKKRFAHHWNPSQFQRIVTPDQNFPNPFSSQTFNKAQETFQETFRTQNSPEHQVETHKLKDAISDMKHEKDILEKEVVANELKQKKLVKAYKEIQEKHEKICNDLKNVKGENDALSKESKQFSVALESCKKTITENQKIYEQKLQNYKVENSKLTDFKLGKIAEERSRKKSEKKARQKEKKVNALNEETVEKTSNKKDEADTTLNNKPFMYTPKSEPEENDDETFETLTHAKATLDSDPSLDEPKGPDNADDHGNISDMNKVEPISTASAPLTKDDLKEVWDFFAERSERIKSWGASS